MKLWVILLCLLSERYLVHALAYRRCLGFKTYINSLDYYFPMIKAITHPYLLLATITLPLIGVMVLILAVTDNLLFGLIGFIVHIIIFYYCLGPDNVFYPVQTVALESKEDELVGDYLSAVNQQLFAVIFWYILTGPLGIVIYRLIAFCEQTSLTYHVATPLIMILNWLPARLTLLFYLLAGNFQHGYSYFKTMLLARPSENILMLANGGKRALQQHAGQKLMFIDAQCLVEHALVIFLITYALISLHLGCY